MHKSAPGQAWPQPGYGAPLRSRDRDATGQSLCEPRITTIESPRISGLTPRQFGSARQMSDEIHRDSVSAWQGLCRRGGIEPEGRDSDLVSRLKEVLDREASDLRAALVNTSTDSFLQALFQVIQPFSMMFRDVLSFFERAGAHKGRNQWKISIQGELIDLNHFEEFLDHWDRIDHVEIPALDMQAAFVPTEIQIGPRYDSESQTRTGIDDVDAWLSEYEKGRYVELPLSLHPSQLGPVLNDLPQIAMAALAIIRTQGLDRAKLDSARRAGLLQPDPDDAFGLGSIAQNETDYWLPHCILHLAALSKKPLQEQESFGAELKAAYVNFPRRRVGLDTEAKDIEKLLSLPAWEKRHEFYGVWVATEMVRGLDAHKVMINHADEELKFAFTKAEIAVVKTARPEIALFSERRTPLNNPVGRNRKNAAQPDLTLWTKGEHEKCILVVEVKHYKKRSARNFKDALEDYARAHPLAEVLLVNYGPVGPAFTDLPESIVGRCKMLGWMSPENTPARDCFQKAVRKCIGSPVVPYSYEEVARQKIFVIDVSLSMRRALTSFWFTNFVRRLERENHDADLVLVDNEIRAVVRPEAFQTWLANNKLGSLTALNRRISRLLDNHDKLVIVTDQEGLENLSHPNLAISQLCIDAESEIMVLRASKPA